VERLSRDLGPETLPVANELARLPEEIRGFGHVKHAAAERVDKQRTALLERLEKARAGNAPASAALLRRGG
jgi:indolepyruvate ferredoxin oxidoreductase